MADRRYPVDSLQIYFPSSLEIQEELIKHGFYVPRSPDKKIVMPIPIIYSNARGWLKQPQPITIERLIPPKWLGVKPEDLNWKPVMRGGKRAYIIPAEEVYTDISIDINKEAVVFNLIVKKYHLERTSIRGINPERWTNWTMFYIDLNYMEDLLDLLEKHLPGDYGQLLPDGKRRPKKEKQQGGKEVTYYVEVPVIDYSLCLGCFNLAMRYLLNKAKEHCEINPSLNICNNPDEVINKLKLRLKYTPRVDAFAKVGIAKIAGKRPQIMVKLASRGPEITIPGVLKPEIRGKARGELINCSHRENEKKQFIALNLVGFYNALTTTKSYINRLPKE